MKYSRLIIYPFIITATAIAFYFALRKDEKLPDYHDGLRKTSRSFSGNQGPAFRGITVRQKNSAENENESFFFDASKAESMPPYFFLDYYHNITARAAHAAQLTESEHRNLQDIIDRTFADVSKDIAENSRLYKTTTDAGVTKRIYHIRAAEDRGESRMANLQSEMIGLLGRDRAKILGRTFSRPVFGGSFRKSDMQLTIAENSPNKDGQRNWNFSLSMAPTDGRGSSTPDLESSDIEQFRLMFGHYFLPDEKSDKQ